MIAQEHLLENKSSKGERAIFIDFPARTPEKSTNHLLGRGRLCDWAADVSFVEPDFFSNRKQVST
jgi:hypothetical protein